MLKNKIISLILVIFYVFSLLNINYTNAVDEKTSYATLRNIDIGTFNEYRYKITEQYFALRDNFKINGNIGKNISNKILELATKGYNYLPDNLNNRNYFNNLSTALRRGIKSPENEANYSAIVKSIRDYLEDTNIESIKGTIEVSPKSGNAPLTVTFRGKVKDPTGTGIPNYNYIWWINDSGKRKIIGNKISISYTFKDEGNFSVFLDVKSNHKNEKGYTDVLPFSSRANIEIKEKVASVIIKVNSDNLRQKEVLKFMPEEARYGLVFDATSSTPTSGGKFIKTEWDFGNGIERENNGAPKVERVIYAKEGEFKVKLKLKTNELKEVERKFTVSIRNPIATINSPLAEGFLGDKFTFSAKPAGYDDNLTYSWEIVDIDRDKVIFRKSGSLFTYSFKNKGKYNVKLRITESSGEEDLDTKIIYINSRSPVADFVYSIPNKSKPNEVFLDGTSSYDPDFSDDGNLIYSWIIDGERVNLENPNFNGSSGYYIFDSIGEHSVVLEVTDPDNISNQKKEKVSVDSILSVEFFAFPRVIQRGKRIKFIANSPEARFYEWDFGDFKFKGGKDEKISHTYEKSGIFEVKLKVIDSDDNENTFKKNVYVGESDRPLAFIGLEGGNTNSYTSEVVFRKNECSPQGAYIANRIDLIKLSAGESINIDGETNNLSYSWKIGNDKYFSTKDPSYKFDQLGCFPVKLTVKSNDNGKTDSTTTWVKVKNLKPTLSSLDTSVINLETDDPVVVKVSALGAKDKDGVIQSFLWYYYTDIDPEPQDFRATNGPSTTFVIPKVTGDYYFVVVMKDNNEERVTSEEVTGGKNSITLVGDNINTPLIDLKVNDSSISVGDEVIFTVVVKNILGQDISKKVSYSWDFDGDGFYDKQKSTSTFSHIFTESGEFHPKVKVKYKGFSNTKTTTINVANKLVADFDYISIGNKFIFLNKSSGKIDKYTWDMGDGNKVEKKGNFVYEYKDKKSNYTVELKISEGTKVRKLSKKIVRNLRNILKTKKPGLNIFSSPEISEEADITLEKATDEVFIYAGSSNGDFKYYSLDYDLDFDSDLNGGKDDDADNKNTPSYTGGDVVKIKLNDKKVQTVRVSLIGEDGITVDSADLRIVKNYIDDDKIDINSINFNGVSDSEKIKIEKLKEIVKNLPQEHRLKALMYVQKLQEEWFDETEKTRVIIEFEGFIDGTGYSKADDMINLLESLLVEGQEDKSEKNITYNALKTLIPKNITCEIPEGYNNCYSSLIGKLDEIKDSNDIEKNKKIGSDLLDVIKDDSSMTNKQKLDFKAILQTFVYGGVENIPKETKNDIENEPESGNLIFLSLLKKVVFWIIGIILVFIIIIILYWIYYKTINKDKHVGFQEFIIDKTSSDNKEKISELKKDKESEKEKPDIIIDKEASGKKEKETLNNKEETKKDSEIDDSKGNLEKQEIASEDNLEKMPKIEESKIPDWLKGSISKIGPEDKQEKQDIKEEAKKDQDKPLESSDTKNTKISDIPDWLKGSFGSKDDEKESDKSEAGQESKNSKLKKAKEYNKEGRVEGGKSETNSHSEEVMTTEEPTPDSLSSLEGQEKDSLDSKLETKNSKKDVEIPDWLSYSPSSSDKDSNKSEKKQETKKSSGTKVKGIKKIVKSPKKRASESDENSIKTE